MISFLTDYGLRDGFVGVCHGVIARGCPDAQVIDLTHESRDTTSIRGRWCWHPRSTTCPTEPCTWRSSTRGSGTARRAIAVLAASGARFVGPDNGLLEPAVSACGGAAEAVDIGRSPFARPACRRRSTGATCLRRSRRRSPLGAGSRRSDRSSILVAGGVAADACGPRSPDAGRARPVRRPVRQPAARRGDGRHRLGDAAGPVEDCSSAWDRPALAISHGVTFADVGTGELVLYEDAHRRPAIAVNRGSAAERLGLGVGDELRIAPIEAAPQ